ncbi:MAG: cell division protein FtsZ [Bacteroidota bacterium]
MSQFEIPQNLNPMENIIKVIGVGGGGSNAVKYLYNLNVKNVDFIVCNTDHQHLMSSPIPNKIQLGKNLTKGLGAGCVPEKGRDAAVESKEDIKRALQHNTEMLFIAAGLGGGTGTGAAPVIAEVARSLNILTVAIVTLPFNFEGKKKMAYAEKGLEELKKYVDSIIVIPNEKLKEIYPGMKMSEAFAKADDVVSTAAKSIAEIITNNLHINVDFNDVRTVMQNSGTALMGTAIARGENRALEALKNAISHPLLANNSIAGAKHILLSITTGSDDISTDEFEAITNYIQEATGETAEVIPGYGTDPSLGDAVSITIVATGFQNHLIEKKSTEISSPFTNVTQIENVDLSNTEKRQTEEETSTPLSPSVEFKTETQSTDIKIEEVPVVQNISKEPESLFSNIENSTEITSLENLPVSEISEPEMSDDNNFSVEINNITPLEIPNDYNQPVVAKIIEKEPANETKDTNVNSTLNQLSDNIKTLSDKSNTIRKYVMDMNNPAVFQELENKPAYLRKKEQQQSSEKNSPSTLKDHSQYTIGDNGEIKPNNPYLGTSQD